MTFLLFFAAFLLLIVVPLATFGWQGWTERGESDWPTVEGKIVSGYVKRRSDGSGEQFCAVLSYRFEGQGEEHDGVATTEWVGEEEAAREACDYWVLRGSVWVAYEPLHPERNRALLGT